MPKKNCLNKRNDHIPKRLDLKLGFACNNHCFFCVQGRKREKQNAKDFSFLQKQLEESYQSGFREVVFTGGEPTLHPRFLDLVRLAKKMGYKEIQIQTNGRTFCYPDFCRKTVLAGATSFSPSLHGHNAATHDFLTRAKGSFAQTVQGILNLKKMNQYILTNSVITSKNYRHLPQMAELFVQLGVTQFQFAYIHLGGEAFDNQKWIAPQKKKVAPFLKKALQIGIDAGLNVMTEAIPPCFLEGYDQHISDLFMPEAKVCDIDFEIEDYGTYRRTIGKVKRADCQKCKFNNVCEGPWREYPDLFGWDEFVPVIENEADKKVMKKDVIKKKKTRKKIEE